VGVKHKKTIRRDIVACILLIILSCAMSALALLLCYTNTVGFNMMPFLMMSIISSFLMIVYYFYLKQINNGNNRMVGNLVSYSIIFITYAISVTMLNLINTVSIPFILCSLLFFTLKGKKEGVLGNCMLSFLMLMAYMVQVIYSGTSFELESVVSILVDTCGGLLVLFLVDETYNRIKIVGVSFCVTIISAIVCILTGLAITMEPSVLLINGMWSLAGGIIAIVLYFLLSTVMEWVFKLNTNLRVMEFLSFDNVLLKELSEKAEGTFNHSIAVSNFAEQCAHAIGENVNLAKAASLYHDVGKLQNPEYFTENQNGYNPHDDLAYEMSVNLITRHTDAGYNILKEKGFPTEIVNVCREHHGTTKLQYFYFRAQSITEGDLDSKDYRYPGPKPSTKISAIVMICDTVEAATRSKGGSLNDQELSDFIGKLIKEKLDDGQFDNCNITIKELRIIRDTLLTAIRGSNHKRISYPEKNK